MHYKSLWIKTSAKCIHVNELELICMYVKLNMSFLAANTQDVFEHTDKKYPMCSMKNTTEFFMLLAYISAGGPGYLVQMHYIMDSIKY